MFLTLEQDETHFSVQHSMWRIPAIRWEVQKFYQVETLSPAHLRRISPIRTSCSLASPSLSLPHLALLRRLSRGRRARREGSRALREKRPPWTGRFFGGEGGGARPQPSRCTGRRAPCGGCGLPAGCPLLGCAWAGAPGKGLGAAPRNRWFEPAAGSWCGPHWPAARERAGGRAGAAQWRLRGGSVAPTAQLARLPPGCRDHLRSGSLIAPHGSSTCECPPGRAASGAASARSLPGPGSAPAAGQEALRARGPEGAAAARALGREPELPHPSV